MFFFWVEIFFLEKSGSDFKIPSSSSGTFRKTDKTEFFPRRHAQSDAVLAFHAKLRAFWEKSLTDNDDSLNFWTIFASIFSRERTASEENSKTYFRGSMI